MSDISLTSSMRNNLLSLQQTTRLQQLTQNRLASGLKVNSAIDNPSSYYTAQSLNNRAEDLNVLLDAMSQGIQTLKAVNEAIESGTKFLEQAKSVASAAIENTQPIAARVKTEAELLAAINSGKQGLIVLERDLTMSTNQNIVLQDGQSLVGARYLDKSAAQTKLSFNFTQEMNSITVGNNSIVADMQINFETTFGKAKTGVVFADNKQNVVVKNIDFMMVNHDPDFAGFYSVSAVMAINKATVTIDGKTNVEGSGARIISVFAYQEATININGKFDANLHGDVSWAFWAHTQATINLNSNSDVNIKSSTTMQPIILNSAAFINIRDGAAFSMSFDSNKTTNENFLYNEYGSDYVPVGAYKPGNGFLLEKGSLVSTYIDGKIDAKYQVIEDILFDRTGGVPNFNTFPASFRADGTATKYNRESFAKNQENVTDKQFNQILAQYDRLVNDASYKGVNLLKSQDLKVVFNESRSSDLEIKGINGTSSGLGLTTANWSNTQNVQDSLDELDNAINQLRLHSSEFGNYYQIVTTREDFTNSLINVLTEGADALTLADMNQESANMLALQTRQQLAINSLSLASQASQSVLKLF